MEATQGHNKKRQRVHQPLLKKKVVLAKEIRQISKFRGVISVKIAVEDRGNIAVEIMRQKTVIESPVYRQEEETIKEPPQKKKEESKTEIREDRKEGR